jgi:vacuolar-type H+-ATPase subunit E/Vma4
MNIIIPTLLVLFAGAAPQLFAFAISEMILSPLFKGWAPPAWYKYLFTLFSGTAMSFTGALFLSSPGKGTLTIMADAFDKAFPFLIGIFAGSAALLLLDWWFHNTKQILKEAGKKADEILTCARNEADGIRDNASMDAQMRIESARETAKEDAKNIKKEAVELQKKAKEEMKLVESLKQELIEEYERKKGPWIEQIKGLENKSAKLTEELRKARKAGIDKMRAEGKEGAARSMEKDLLEIIGPGGEKPDEGHYLEDPYDG